MVPLNGAILLHVCTGLKNNEAIIYTWCNSMPYHI